MKKALVAGGFVSLSIALLAVSLPGEEKAAPQKRQSAKKQDQQPKKAAVNRTRDTVKMLDDVYKQAIVLITDKYVNDESDFPAGSAAVELFKRVGKTGYHQVRLLDATGQPYEEKNVAKTDFEKEGVKQLKGGKDFYEEVVIKKGKPYLYAMTPVPVVMKKCIMCHPHYADVKQGEPIGAISYELPIRSGFNCIANSARYNKATMPTQRQGVSSLSELVTLLHRADGFQTVADALTAGENAAFQGAWGSFRAGSRGSGWEAACRAIHCFSFCPRFKKWTISPWIWRISPASPR